MKSIIGLSVALAAALSFGGGSPADAQSQAGAVHDDGQWTMPGKDYASTRFSGLAQITASNAKSLRPMWSFSTGVLGGHEGQPLVVGNTMYVVTPYPNVVYAFDLTKEGYPLRWKYRPSVNGAAIGIACCDVVNRGAFYANGQARSTTCSTAIPSPSMRPPARKSGRPKWPTSTEARPLPWRRWW